MHWFDQLTSYLLYGCNLLLLIGTALLLLASLRLLKLGHGRHWRLAIAGCACLLLAQCLGLLLLAASFILANLGSWIPAWIHTFTIITQLVHWLRPPGYLLVGIAILRHALILRQGAGKDTSAEASIHP